MMKTTDILVLLQPPYSTTFHALGGARIHLVIPSRGGTKGLMESVRRVLTMTQQSPHHPLCSDLMDR